MVKNYFRLLIFSMMFLFITVSMSWADYMADITYDYTGGPGSYTLDFTVSNTSNLTSTGGLDYFEIFFDTGGNDDYSSITWINDNSWLSGADDPISGFGGDAGFVNADDSVSFGAGGGGIAMGNSLDGFKVSFDYTGSLGPEAFTFSWYANFGTSDADNGGADVGGYWILGEADGYVRFEDQGDPPDQPVIPEPGTMILFGLGLLGLAGINRKK